MFHAGATGYMLKDHAFEELARAIRTLVSNRVYVSPGIAGIVKNQ
jgi:DNA-binding NarL/FixJ family response regulator